MNLVFNVMLAGTIFCVLALCTVAVVDRSATFLKLRAFTQIVAPTRSSRRADVTRETSARLFEMIRLVKSAFNIKEDPELLRQFDRANLETGIAHDLYFAARFGLPALMLLLGSLSPYKRLLCMCAGAGITYLMPAIVLRRMVKKRREKIRLAIPDAVDLLVICVDAGLGLDQAMVRVGEELSSSHPEVNEEFEKINRAQRTGTLRLDAWREMAERTALPETEALVNMLMQTERFGTPIARALSSFGEGIRQKRRQKAEEAAAKTTIKIIFPLVFCIFPCIFIVLLGPAAISIFRGMADTAH